jgi:Mg2+ and Co2+ transporter CorA
MPLTLLSGIYGMNLIRLPYADRPIVIFGMFIAVVIMVTVIIAFIYRQTNYRK